MKLKNYLKLLIFLFCTNHYSNTNLKTCNGNILTSNDIICDNVSQIGVSDITLNSATITWIAGTSNNSWDVAVALATEFDPTVVAFSNAATTAFVKDNLIAGATYKVWVRSVCSVNETSDWVGPVLFTTACNPVSGFYESFDTTTTPSLPLCWSKIIRGDNVSIAAKVQTIPYSGISAPNAIEITNWASSGEYDIILVSPNLANLSSGTHRLRFTSKGVATLEIGTLNNNTNQAIFSEIDEVFSTQTITEHVISFESYTGTDAFVGIRLAASATNNFIYLDNMVWEAIPPCDDVTNVVATSTTANSANFIWTPANTETTWHVAIGASSVIDPFTLSFQTVLFENTTSDSYFVATGLASLTTYKMWVRSVCSEGLGAWIGPVVFTTGCPAATVFSENFDSTAIGSLPTCWSKILRGAGLSSSAKVEVINAPIVVSKSVNLSNNNSTGSYDIILVSPQVSTLPLASHQLRFFAKFASIIEVGTLSSNTNSAVFTAFQTVTTVNGLAEYIVDFSSYTGTNQFIGIRIPSNASVFTGITLDNLVWEAIPSCPEISNITVPTVTETTAEINWTSTPVETSWQVAYGTVSVVDPNTLIPISASIAPFELTGLVNSTTYKVWVRAVCEDGNGAWIGPVQFTTECPPIANFIENFDNVTLPNLPLCWSKIKRGVGISQFAGIDTKTTNVESFPNFTAPNYVSLNPQGSQPTADIILVSPKLSTLSLGTHRLKFDSYYPGSIQVGTLNGNTATALFTPIQTVQSGSLQGSSFVINFSSYTGSDTYIGLRVVPDPANFPNVYLDNITWEPIPACPDVTQISVMSTSQTGASFTWNAGGNEQSWQVVVAQSTVSDPNTATPQSASSNSITVGGLVSATNYKVWVRSVCANENGAWIGPVLFRTPCDQVDVPYVENFQSASIPNLPECTSSQVTSNGSNSWVSHTGATNFGFPSKALRYYDSMDTADAWFFTRAISLVAGESYTISYKKGTNSNFSWMGANLKVMYGTSATSNAMTNTLADHVGFYGSGIVENIPFTVGQTGIYYFSFHVYSPAYASSVFVDDITVQAVLSTHEETLVNFKFYPNPVNDILTLTNTEDINEVTIYNIVGQQILSKKYSTTEVKIDMSSFPKGTYLAKVKSANQIQTIKILKN